MNEFVNVIIGGVTSGITLTTVSSVVVTIIGAGIVAIFAWKFARFGYNFIVGSLSGYDGFDYAREGARQRYYAKHGKMPKY